MWLLTPLCRRLARNEVERLNSFKAEKRQNHASFGDSSAALMPSGNERSRQADQHSESAPFKKRWARHPGVLNGGGDFADGVIAHEGEWMGAEEFVSFDSAAVSLLHSLNVRARLLSQPGWGASRVPF